MEAILSEPQQSSVASKQKKIVERSAAYPNLTFNESSEFISTVYKQFPVADETITRDDIGAVFKTKAHNIQREVSSAVQYGLLVKNKEGYQISPFFKVWKNAFASEIPKLKLDAFKSPKLYADLIEKFDGHALPPELTTHLIRNHDIAEKAAPQCAEIFIKNAEDCGALDENKILGFKKIYAKVSNPDFKPDEPLLPNDSDDKKTDSTQLDITSTDSSIAPIKPTKQIPEMLNEEKIKVRLTEGKFAYIIYPLNINIKDISVLRKQLDVLEELVT